MANLKEKIGLGLLYKTGPLEISFTAQHWEGTHLQDVALNVVQVQGFRSHSWSRYESRFFAMDSIKDEVTSSQLEVGLA